MVEIEEILWEKQIQISKDREKRVRIYIYISIFTRTNGLTEPGDVMLLRHRKY